MPIALAPTPISGAASAAKTGGVNTAMATSAWIASVAMRANIGRRRARGWAASVAAPPLLRQPDARAGWVLPGWERKTVCGGRGDHILYLVVTGYKTTSYSGGLMETIWTQDLVTQLSALWKQGLSTAEIGRRLNI